MTGVLCGASPLVESFSVADTAVDRGVSGEPAPDLFSDVLCGYLWNNFRDARGVYQALPMLRADAAALAASAVDPRLHAWMQLLGLTPPRRRAQR